MFGKLTMDLFPTDPIILGACAFMAVLVALVLALLTYFKLWGWLWREWLTTVDHKKIGIMYIIGALVMFIRGAADAFMMRGHLAMAFSGKGFLLPDHYDQLFTAHGTIMVFFMAMPFMFGLMNLVMPLQIGARDVAFPFLNALSFWLFVAGALLVNLSLVLGSFATAGWLAYPPLSGIFYSPGVGMDYYIWSIQISGIGSLITAINFVVTIIKMRAPGMKMMQMPVFTWSVFCASILMMIIFPFLTISLTLLALDRYMDMHFFTSTLGGNPMLYINLIWAWGHPEVYVLVLPAFGIYSEIAATFSRKQIFGYKTMVWAMLIILVLSFLVWAHHFFTMGAGGSINAVFGIATMIIAIPTGVKIFNWLFTMHKGKIKFSTPMLWLIGFIVVFLLGGMTGVMLSIPAADFQFHNSLFLVAHFHNTIIGGVVFGYFAGFVYWWPKFFGYKLNECLGKCAFVSWFIGFFVAFTPIYILGFMGATRRISTYSEAEWQMYFIIAFFGTMIIGLGFVFQVLQLVVSFIQHKKNVAGNDPWHGRTLEWSIPSPAPFYNFAKTPTINEGLDTFWTDKQNNKMLDTSYEAIHMPRNSAIPVIFAFFTFICGFALVFHIFWLALITFIVMVIVISVRSFDYDRYYYVTVEEIKAIEEKGAVQNTEAIKQRGVHHV